MILKIKADDTVIFSRSKLTQPIHKTRGACNGNHRTSWFDQKRKSQISSHMTRHKVSNPHHSNTTIKLWKYLGKFVRIGPMLHGLKEFFKGKVLDGLMGLFIGFIQIFVGALELISEFVRVISFTFRLFGNMTAGATVVLMIAFLIPWLVPVPFYGLEMILGFVQALIFGGLTLVFAATAITPHEEH